MRSFLRLMLLMLLLSMVSIAVTALDEDIPPAPIANDEGGVQVVRGESFYTNPFFTASADDGFIILEDQTGFVTRDFDYVFPLESQVFAQITSSIFESPFSYVLQLPVAPQAPLNDVDNDGEEDIGVQIYQVAYWSNTYGDIYLEERDGRGWSGSNNSVITESEPPERIAEYIGGNILIYAPVAGQAFPSGFGDDDALFTEDDPLVIIPQGWTLVNMDTETFTFDRSREVDVPLLEAEGAALDDFSELSYTEAWDAMIEKMKDEYAFTEFAGFDWDEISAEFRPRIEEAEANEDPEAYYYAMWDFTVAIGDRHHNSNAVNFLIADFQEITGGGLGIAIRELTDGRVIVNFLLEDGPADEAGVELGAEIVAIDGVPIMEAVANTRAWSEPFNTEHVRTLQRLRYVVRFPLGTEVELTFVNPDGDEQTETMEVINERESFNFSSFNRDLSTTRLPVMWEIINGTMVVEISGFADDPRLTIELWERMMVDALQQQVAGVVIDMRNNSGGFLGLAYNMAAYFFDEEFELGNTSRYNENIDGFYTDDRFTSTFRLPEESLRFGGPVAVLIGPNCFSACEFFSYAMTVDNRADIVGQYPTIGGGGSTEVFLMPDGLSMQTTIGRAVDADGEIHIQNQGVAPTVLVPVDEDTLGLTDVTYINNDPILDTAIQTILNGSD
ncbi:MAG: S41 family peptidase [Chloroflexota bacterium]